MESLVLAMVTEPSVCADARGLLGRILTSHGVSAVITEVEAYDGPRDPASHAYTRTPRSETMYGPAMRLYVYRIHGHHCANIVTSPEGEGSAVLIRAGRIVDGLDVARQRRQTMAEDEFLGRGPGNLAKSLGITMADLRTDLTETDGVHLGERVHEPVRIAAGPRVGIRLAADEPWRFWVDGEPSVSAYRRHPKAGSRLRSTNG
ncbi:DNA-3-methyladenine glycosylase [Gordonia sp. HY002]|uniref:DNA-3-methyladenine glycosylase n=1 Tax=Gordonia zhenghanii TaxID=2911516 RepID=UPI001EEFBCCE|nr:DNA-3-methyladenine glycosylase [Gordonia zhenghanii]MCF8568842.1 DNA-3-methyladenine glycosylase [Gordonia zhenghanii]MCF8602288.1 DNA-3-methyladenine glycosylase [Gordonia zhenghanii]